MIGRACVLILALNGAFLFGQENVPKRIVSVCALNDAQLQPQGVRVKEKTIRRAIEQASKEYEKNVGIILKLVEYHDAFISAVPLPEHAAALRAACKKGEIVAVFTNQAYDYHGLRMTGWSDKERGILWTYQVESRRRNSTLLFRMKMLVRTTWRYHHFSWGEQEEPPELTFKHEVAHLFGVDHSPRNTDFMYYCASSPSWSERIRTILRENREMTWDAPMRRAAAAR